MKFILIMWMSFPGDTTVPVQLNEGFSTLAACEQAGATWEHAMRTQDRGSVGTHHTCIPVQ